MQKKRINEMLLKLSWTRPRPVGDLMKIMPAMKMVNELNIPSLGFSKLVTEGAIEPNAETN